MSVKDAAAAASINYHTVREWKLFDSEFQGMLAETEDRAVEAFLEEGVRQVRNQIMDLGPRAADVLRDSLEHTDPKVRLQAAGMVLRHGGGPAANVNLGSAFEGLIGGSDPASGD